MQRRNTMQRQIVYQSLMYLGHATVESLIEYIKLKDARISLASIYRNITILLEEGRIRRVSLETGDVLETVKEKHSHFVCHNCGMIYDIPCPKDKVFDRYVAEISHQIQYYDIALYGICQKCKKQEEEYEVRL